MEPSTPQTAAQRARERITQLNQSTSPLLRLPAELRNRIYSLAFTSSTILVSPGPRGQVQPAHNRPGTLTLLFTCRQIRHEASPLLYTLSTFDVRLFDRRDAGINELVHTLGSDACRLITCIEFDAVKQKPLEMATWLPSVRHVIAHMERCASVDWEKTLVDNIRGCFAIGRRRKNKRVRVDVKLGGR